MNSPRTGANVTPALSLLAFMLAIGPFGDTEYTPAMPAIAHALQADYAAVQLTMASYLFGSAAMQLIYGPLSDRFGRRGPMLAGAAILVLGSALCLTSPNVGVLIGGRLVQGIGACAGGVIVDAVVRDAFAAERRQRVYAKLNAGFALAPAAGPIVGTYLTGAFGWRATFAILVAVSVLMCASVYRWLPETKRRRELHAFEPKRLWRTYVITLRTRGFALYAVLGGCCVGVVYAALIGAPDLVINVLHRGSGSIIIVALSILLGFVAGAGLCALLTNRIDAMWIVTAGLATLLASSFVLLGVALRIGDGGTLADYLAPISVSFGGVGLVVPVTIAKGMAPFQRTAGSASSLLGFVRIGVAALSTVAMSLLHQGSALDMPIVFLALSIIAILVFWPYVHLHGMPQSGGARRARRVRSRGAE